METIFDFLYFIVLNSGKDLSTYTLYMCELLDQKNITIEL